MVFFCSQLAPTAASCRSCMWPTLCGGRCGPCTPPGATSTGERPAAIRAGIALPSLRRKSGAKQGHMGRQGRASMHDAPVLPPMPGPPPLLRAAFPSGWLSLWPSFTQAAWRSASGTWCAAKQGPLRAQALLQMAQSWPLLRLKPRLVCTLPTPQIERAPRRLDSMLPAHELPAVDVYIVCCSEPVDVIEPTSGWLWGQESLLGWAVGSGQRACCRTVPCLSPVYGMPTG